MKPYQHQTHYELLEVSAGAGEGELREAHDRLQALYAPDSVALYTLADPSEADALRARISEAFAVLVDPSRRTAYDEHLRAVAAAAPPVVVPPPPAAPAPRATKSRKPRAPRAPQAAAPARPGPAPTAVAAPVVSTGQGSWSTTGISFTWTAPPTAAGTGWVPYGLAATPVVPPAAASASAVPAAPIAAPSGNVLDEVAGGLAQEEASPAPVAGSEAEQPAPVPASAEEAAPQPPEASPAPIAGSEAKQPAPDPASAVEAAPQPPEASPAPVAASEAELPAPAAASAVEAAPQPPEASPEPTAVAGVALSAPLAATEPQHAALPSPSGQAVSIPDPLRRPPGALSGPPVAAEVSLLVPRTVPAAVSAPQRPPGGAEDPGLRALRAIPAWPTTGEEMLPPEVTDPVTDAENELPLETLLADDLEELDPEELLELDPEPPVDVRGEPVKLVQQVMSFEAPTGAAPPPPLPAHERTVTPVQFRQLDTSWGFKVPPPPAPPPARTPLAAPPTIAPPPPPRGAPLPPPPPEPPRSVSVPAAPPAAVAPVPEPAVVAPVLAPVPGVPAPPPPETALVLASSKAREIKPRPADFPPDTVFNGELLRKVRTAQGITLDDIAARTRISRKTLENVEADRYADLPAHVYLRGTLMGIATTLGLDPIRVAKSYLDLCQAAKPPAKR